MKLECTASMGLICRGDVMKMADAMDDLNVLLEKYELKVVYKLVYPGKLRVVREPIVPGDE